MKRMHVIVAGSRTVDDYDYVARSLNNVLGDEPDVQIVIISGTAKGADSMGAKWANLTAGISLVEMPAQWDKYGKAAGYRRNQDMATIASHVIVFWDGKSRGAKHMIDIAKKLELPCRVLPAHDPELQARAEQALQDEAATAADDEVSQQMELG
jgi:hypothetical protein